MTGWHVGGAVLSVFSLIAMGVLIGSMFTELVSGTVVIANGQFQILASPMEMGLSVSLTKMSITDDDGTVQYSEDPFEKDGLIFSRCDTVYQKLESLDHMIIAATVLVAVAALAGIVSVAVKSRRAWIPLIVGSVLTLVSVILLAVCVGNMVYISNNYDTCLEEPGANDDMLIPDWLRGSATTAAPAGVRRSLLQFANLIPTLPVGLLTAIPTITIPAEVASMVSAAVDDSISPAVETWFNSLPADQRKWFLAQLVTGVIADVHTKDMRLQSGAALLIVGMVFACIAFVTSAILSILYFLGRCTACIIFASSDAKRAAKSDEVRMAQPSPDSNFSEPTAEGSPDFA